MADGMTYFAVVLW